jgi:lipoprotein-anchoring transpeptidase ErfK/SrfK
MQVQGFSDSMPMYSHCRYVTWFQIARGIAFHYYPTVPNYPASHGCVRLNAHTAQLIHNNAKIGATEVKVQGKWEFVR